LRQGKYIIYKGGEASTNIMDIALLHKCCDEKNIRVRDIFFWNEQYLHDNVGYGQ